MKKSLMVFNIVLVVICFLFTVQSVNAQEAVPDLSDLVGAKAGQAEGAVKDRGYTWVKTEKSDVSAYSYWTENETGKCVTIRTEEGRYQSIVYAPELDCQDDATAKSEPVTAASDGNCVLFNKKSNNNKYKGSCKIEHTTSDDLNMYAITFDNGQAYTFKERTNGFEVNTPKGLSKNMATMLDKGEETVFKWGKWKLSVIPASTETESSSERAGQGDYDATGQIPCAEAKGQPMNQCDFAVAREGNGSATVTVTLSDGRTRNIFFENGNAVSADLSQADGNMDFKATKESGLYMINAGDERYEIPEAVIYGG